MFFIGFRTLIQTLIALSIILSLKDDGLMVHQPLHDLFVFSIARSLRFLLGLGNLQYSKFTVNN